MRRFEFTLKMSNGDSIEGIRCVGESPEDAVKRLKDNPQARGMIDFDNVAEWLYREIEYEEVNPENYRFEKSAVRPGWYVVTDLRNMIVTIFPHGQFNSDQKHTQLADKNDLSVMEMATVMRELGEYLALYHPEEAGV